MRPLWVHYPADEQTWEMADQWLVGADLLVKPVTAQGALSSVVYLPGVEGWFGVRDGSAHPSPGAVTVAAPLGTIPVFQRGGSILPRQMRLRRSSALMGRSRAWVGWRVGMAWCKEWVGRGVEGGWGVF